MTQSEQVLWQGSPSQLINIKLYFFCGLLFWLVIPLFIMYWSYLKTKNTKFKITSERLILQEGVFNKVTDQIELYRVKDIHLEEPLLMRIFSLGNIIISTSDKDLSKKLMPAMSKPENLKDTIRDTVEKLRVEKNVREMDFR